MTRGQSSLTRGARPRLAHVAKGALVTAASILFALGVAGGGGAMAASPPRGDREPKLVTTFQAGQFPEGLVVNRAGTPIVSVTTFGATQQEPGHGQVVKVSNSGAKKPFGPRFNVGAGVLTGLALDRRGGVYLADAAFRAPAAAGVLRIGPGGSASRVLRLPDSDFPNGVAVRHGAVFVSDSVHGKIYRVDRRGGNGSVWLKSKLLAPKKAFGANGIAFWRGSLYVAVTDSGRIVRVPVHANGAAGHPRVVVRSKRLHGADGITFDSRGRLYIATSSTNKLMRLNREGHLVKLADQSDGLRYPTTPAFDPKHPRLLYLVNGDFEGTARPTLVRFRLPHAGSR